MNDKTKWENAHFEHDANPVDGSMYKPAAAQEAVAWVDIANWRAGIPADECFFSDYQDEDTIPLYAAPVAAAPVEGWDAQAYAQMADELEAWKQRAMTAEEDFNRLHEAMNAEDGPTYMGEPVLSNPAAPGIDLEQFRIAVQAYLFRQQEFGSVAGIAEGKRLLALIDASPKGGSDYVGDFGAMTDLLSRWRHNAAIEPSPNPMAKARREVWVQCLDELESALQATSHGAGVSE